MSNAGGVVLTKIRLSKMCLLRVKLFKIISSSTKDFLLLKRNNVNETLQIRCFFFSAHRCTWLRIFMGFFNHSEKFSCWTQPWWVHSLSYIPVPIDGVGLKFLPAVLLIFYLLTIQSHTMQFCWFFFWTQVFYE